MRKQIKNQMLELLDSMTEATQILKTYSIQNDWAEILYLLQMSAVQVGETIEKEEKFDSAIIDQLLILNKEAWECSQEDDFAIKQTYIKKIEDIIEKVKKIAKEIPVKIEVVFFPYNASMWDSLESIWIAAENDAETEAFVVPIPFFERDSNGVICEPRYEGKNLPSYVPIIDYRNYNFKERKPDIAYIHNPFDQYNLITRVHPDYFSHELKKYVNRVVYVPYFISINAVSYAHRELPSYYQVDYIVVQNEKMIESFSSDIARDKFLTFGSPIVDRIINLNKNKPEIPDEWKEMLPNGKDFAGCKVFMLNTSLSMIMKEREVFLDKIKHILKILQKRDDIVVVWRPHPLMYSTLQALGGTIYNEYLEIEDAFIKKNIGILDRTKDVGVTIALCDGYIGEEASSIIRMFEITKKPMFYINNKIYDKVGTCDNYVSTYGIYKENEDEYFVAEEYHTICKKNKHGKIEVIAQLPKVGFYNDAAYKDIIKFGDNLYIQPYSSEGLVIYSLKSKRIRKKFVKNSRPYDFLGMVEINGFLYLIPNEYNYLVRFSMESEQFEYLDASDLEKYGIRQDVEHLKLQVNHIKVEDIELPKIKAIMTAKKIIMNSMFENEENRLEDFIDYFADEKLSKMNNGQTKSFDLLNERKYTNLEGTSGKKIHEFVKEMVN